MLTERILGVAWHAMAGYGMWDALVWPQGSGRKHTCISSTHGSLTDMDQVTPYRFEEAHHEALGQC